MSIDVLREATLFLATCRTAALATSGDGGEPHAANVQYAQEDARGRVRLYWVSSPEAAHSRHLARDPRAAVAIYAHNDAVENIHGLQLHGRVEAVDAADEAEWNRVFELYTAKFAFLEAMPQLRAAIDAQSFYCFTPTWLRWIDNRRGFGFKVELKMAGR